VQRSETHILTTHAGALPRPDDLLALNAELAQGRPTPELERAHHDRLATAVTEVVRTEREIGIDVINDGEYGKAMRARSEYGAWLSYVMQRLTGWEPTPGGDRHAEPASGVGPRGFYQRRDRQAFPELYAQIPRDHQSH
jgi:5-methyltetrahydropteroyltriglutamate--homocysteine methyltransferase